MPMWRPVPIQSGLAADFSSGSNSRAIRVASLVPQQFGITSMREKVRAMTDEELNKRWCGRR